ncbi:hypothetical protein AUR64_18650 [Haloprofundus marisrubri]|uniref:ABC transmembrane type-1 domain-containing protein n=1 Tax=Haloprofundus marisrubri TaxID=1514971 RepID=A0A0W1R6F0_9EURY|nr:ABC transporter permease [Haloprofundus marisrubri]KTG08685.1 hypothetical protein AUR64_18650 [Haloprofundus marisrubri]
MSTDTGTGTDTDRPEFERVDWDDHERSRFALRGKTVALLVALAALLVTYVYHINIASLPTWVPYVFPWDATDIEWLFALSLVFAGFFVVAPLVSNPRLTRLYWRRLTRSRLAVVAFGYLAFFVFVGLAGPTLADWLNLGVNPDPRAYVPISQPPVGVGVDQYELPFCAGSVTDGQCYGTTLHPLGTTASGDDVLLWLVDGTNIALQIALITSMLLVPLATAVGTLAAYFGGWVDELLMRYVDIQQVIPAFFVFLVAQYFYGGSLFLFILVFGLFNWGGVARLVRSEALQRTEEEYVLAARSVGSGHLRVVTRHLVPNVSNTVLTAVTLQIPTLLVVEATLSYLGFVPGGARTWGNLIALGLRGFPQYWWVVAPPVVVLFLTVVAFNVVGDALRDVLDPRGGEGT